MSEGIELPEGYGHEDHPLILPVSITVSIMAVLVAGVSLLGHRAHTEELLHQSQAASRWEQYQAKTVRLHQAQGFSDMAKLGAPVNKEEGEELKKSTEMKSNTMRVTKKTSPKRQKIWKANGTWTGVARIDSMAERPFWKLGL